MCAGSVKYLYLNAGMIKRMKSHKKPTIIIHFLPSIASGQYFAKTLLHVATYKAYYQ